MAPGLSDLPTSRILSTDSPNAHQTVNNLSRWYSGQFVIEERTSKYCLKTCSI